MTLTSVSGCSFPRVRSRLQRGLEETLRLFVAALILVHARQIADARQKSRMLPAEHTLAGIDNPLQELLGCLIPALAGI
jgi:hypothetical protein